MPRIGVVLSGCAGKGAYEIGCMLAIREYFGAENIKCISSASMGAVIGHPTSLGRIEEMEHAFREMDSGKSVIFMANLPAAADNETDGKDYWRILHMDDINQIYKKAAEKADFPLISMYDLFSDYCKENALTVDELLCDGLHPNDRGYDVMYELLIKELAL